MQLSTSRWVCEKCGRVTLTKLNSECQLQLWRDDMGQFVFVSLCPEHRAELVRILSDFLGEAGAA